MSRPRLVSSTSRVPHNLHMLACCTTIFVHCIDFDNMPDRPPFPARPAQPPGPTYLSYSPDGRRLNVAGSSNFARSFRTNDLNEPDLLLDTHEDAFAIASGNDFVILGCEDGTVCQHNVPGGALDKMLFRSTLPIRDLALSPNEKWLAVSSESGYLPG